MAKWVEPQTRVFQADVFLDVTPRSLGKQADIEGILLFTSSSTLIMEIVGAL
jgi:hypothetical protein